MSASQGSWAWPRPSEMPSYVQANKRPWVIPEAPLMVREPLKPASAVFPPVEWGCASPPPPHPSSLPALLLCAHWACSKRAGAFSPHRRVATIPVMVSVKCHMFWGERHSPEGTGGMVIIITPLWRGRGYLAWCHHLLRRQLLPGCMCSPSCGLFCLASRLPWAAAGAACSSAQAARSKDADEGWCPHLGAVGQCLFIQQIFIECLLWAKHEAKHCWGTKACEGEEKPFIRHQLWGSTPGQIKSH